MKQEFGQGLADDVLVSVLEMFQGNVQETINFLRAGQGDYVDDPNANQGSKLPAGYLTAPEGWSASSIAQHARPTTPAANMKEFILRPGTSFHEHFTAAAGADKHLYKAVLVLLLQSGVDIGHGAKVRTLAVALGTGDRDLADYLLLDHRDEFDLPILLAALRFLDLPRKVAWWEKKLGRLERQGTAKPSTIALLRGRLAETRNTMFEGQETSVNGALCRRLKGWARSIAREVLEFIALSLPKDLWLEFAQFAHPAPSDFQLDYFLTYCFGAPAPEASIVANCAQLNAENVEALTARFNIPYSWIRRTVPKPSALVKERVASYEQLTTVLWWYEELQLPSVDRIIEERLDRGDAINLPYGKLMERLLYFKMNGCRFYPKLIPLAEQRIRSITLVLEPPVMVIGDASFSMDVAIRTSTIIASLLCALAHADLRFFNDRIMTPELIPITAADVIEVASATKADGLTAPAVALTDLYAERRVVKYFVVVTDEIENEAHDGQFFAQLFYKYYTEVYPARIVMVSFLESTAVKGRMVQALEQFGIIPLQFRLDGSLPDLTKIDSLLGLLSSESEFFSTQSEEMAEMFEAKAPLADVLQKLRNKVAFQATRPAEPVAASSAPVFRPELEEE